MQRKKTQWVLIRHVRKSSTDASHLLVLSRVSSEGSPGCWWTFIHYHLPLPVFHRNTGPKTLMFNVPCEYKKKAATVCCLLSHTTSMQHREHWQLLCEVTLIAVAPAVSRLCTFHPCHSPPSVFSLVLSFSSHSGDRGHLGRRKRVYQSHRKPANGRPRES